jgi:pSer/pThr/pTyr-binding forkhead associated (FHA) protein
MTIPSIFLSYGHHDQSWCEELARYIRGIGFDLWYDEGITSGSVWLKTLEDELQARDIFLIVLSPEAWISPWVQRELQLALVTQKTIMPIVLRETAVGGFLLTIQWINAIGMTPPVAGQRIVAHLQGPAPVAGPPTLSTTLIQRPTAPASAPPRLFIWSIENTDTSRCISVFRPRLMIGREQYNDIVLNDPAVSRHHAELYQESDGWHLRRHPDGGMVYHNGRPLVDAKLKTLDQLVMGMTLMRIEIPPAPSDGLGPPVPILLIDCPECHLTAPLREPELIMGRAPESDLVIPAPIISHTAAHLRREPDGRYTLCQITNRNPMRLGDTTIDQHTLAHDDRVMIGDRSVGSMVILRYTTAVL